MYERPGHRHYATAATTHQHGAPVVYDGVPGIAFKQAVVSSGAGSGAIQSRIADSENFEIICKGRVEITNPSTFTRGENLYITSGHVLTSVSTSNTKFGKVVEIAGERGTPTGQMRVDLDLARLF